MIAYDLKYNFVADAMMTDFCVNSTLFLYKKDGFEPCTKIVFEIKLILVTGLATP